MPPSELLPDAGAQEVAFAEALRILRVEYERVLAENKVLRPIALSPRKTVLSSEDGLKDVAPPFVSDHVHVLVQPGASNKQPRFMDGAKACPVLQEFDVQEIATEKDKKACKVNIGDDENIYGSSSTCAQIALHPHFQTMNMVMIIVYAIWMGIDADWNSALLITERRAAGQDANVVFQMADHFFCLYFAAELVLRYFAYQRCRDRAHDPWFVFDAILVPLTIFDTWDARCFAVSKGNDHCGPGYACRSTPTRARPLNSFKAPLLGTRERGGSDDHSTLARASLVLGAPGVGAAAILKWLAMPGLWVHLADNPDFYRTFEISKGAYIETTLYDEADEEQGRGLWRLAESEARKKDGLWCKGKLVAVSDEHLHWWLTKGAGQGTNRVFNLHFCVTTAKECRKTKRKPEQEFHTDYFRTLEVSDVTERRVAWFKSPPAKEDVDVEISKLAGGAPRGRTAMKAGTGQRRAAELEWSLSDDDELPDLDPEEEAEVGKKLADLKRQTARTPKERDDKTPPKRKEDESGQTRKAKKKKKKKESSRSGTEEKKGPLWFGSRRTKSPHRGDRRRSRSRKSSRGRERREKKSRSPSSSDGRRAKKKRKGDHADRGPYGVGQKLRYDGQNSSDISSEDEDADDQSSVFRSGPSGTSKHLQLQEYAEKRPGRLTARLLRKMRDILAREEGPLSMSGTQNLTPATASSYYLTVIVPQYRERLNLRTSRELRSIAKALDLLAQGKNDKAGDVLSQRYKALELSLADQSWGRAQFIELIPPEGASLVEKDEVLMASKEQSTEQKLRASLAPNLWRPSQKGEGKTDEKGKSKGKGKGKKGRGPGMKPEPEKPPPS
eukprot:s280_g16.t1